jgi:putative tryptophan/tyrosine transport system substrate-binding protein
LPQLAAELVQLNVDVLVAGGYTTVLPAVRATDSIPVVFFGSSDPVKLGIVKSLARPGGNVTGFTVAPSQEYYPKLRELLRDTVPRLRRVGILSDSTEEWPVWWPLMEDGARALGLADQLRRARVPSIANGRELPQAGGFMSYGVNFQAVFARMAEYVDRILRGAKPADLPVQHPTTFELVLNLKTANALGITIPPSMLARADEIIR